MTGKFGLRVQNKQGKRLTKFFKRKCGHSKHISSNSRDDSTHGHHQMVNSETGLIILFAVEDGEVLYSQHKQDLKLTVAQIISSLLAISGLN